MLNFLTALIKPVFELFKGWFLFNAGQKDRDLDHAEDALKNKDRMGKVPPATERDTIDSLRDGDF